MAKKTKSNKDLINLLMAILGILAVATMFFVSVQGKDVDLQLKGTELAFGKELGNILGLTSAKLNVNFGLLFAYIASLVASLLVIFRNKKMDIVIVVLFIVSAVLFFASPGMTKVTYELLGASKTFDVTLKMALGSYLGAGFTIVATLLGIYKQF